MGCVGLVCRSGPDHQRAGRCRRRRGVRCRSGSRARRWGVRRGRAWLVSGLATGRFRRRMRLRMPDRGPRVRPYGRRRRVGPVTQVRLGAGRRGWYRPTIAMIVQVPTRHRLDPEDSRRGQAGDHKAHRDLLLHSHKPTFSTSVTVTEIFVPDDFVLSDSSRTLYVPSGSRVRVPMVGPSSSPLIEYVTSQELLPSLE